MIDTTFGRWKLEEGLTFNLFVEIMDSYYHVLRDDVDWVDFADLLKHSVLLTSPGAWCSFNEIKPGLRACFHGAGWKYSSKVSRGRCLHDLKALVLPEIFRRFDLKALIALIPAQAEDAIKSTEFLGFTPSGVVPYDSTWNGVSHDSILMSLDPKEV